MDNDRFNAPITLADLDDMNKMHSIDGLRSLAAGKPVDSNGDDVVLGQSELRPPSEIMEKLEDRFFKPNEDSKMRFLDPNEDLHPLVKIARKCFEDCDVKDLVGLQKMPTLLVGTDPWRKSSHHLGHISHLGLDHLTIMEEMKRACAEIVMTPQSCPSTCLTTVDTSQLSRLRESPLEWVHFVFDSLISFPVTPDSIKTPEENFQEIKKKKSEFHQGISKRILKQRRRF